MYTLSVVWVRFDLNVRFLIHFKIQRCERIFCILPRQNEGPFIISWFCKILTAETRYQGQLIRANLCRCLACSSRRGNYFACRVVALRTKFLNSTTRRFFHKRKPIEKQRGDRNLRETEEIRGCQCVSMNYGVLPLSFSRASNSFRTIFFQAGSGP